MMLSNRLGKRVVQEFISFPRLTVLDFVRFLWDKLHAYKEENEISDARGTHDDARLPDRVAAQRVAFQGLLTRLDARARKCVIAREREA